MTNSLEMRPADLLGAPSCAAWAGPVAVISGAHATGLSLATDVPVRGGLFRDDATGLPPRGAPV